MVKYLKYIGLTTLLGCKVGNSVAEDSVVDNYIPHFKKYFVNFNSLIGLPSILILSLTVFKWGDVNSPILLIGPTISRSILAQNRLGECTCRPFTLSTSDVNEIHSIEVFGLIPQPSGILVNLSNRHLILIHIWPQLFDGLYGRKIRL